MSLLDYEAPSEAISHRGKPLMEVRGLSLEIISRLMRDHMEDINRLVELGQGSREEVFSRLNTDGFMLKLLTDAPVVIVECIALAADLTEKAHVDKIRSLPASLQLAAMQAIVRLTLEDIGGPKGLAALFRSMTS